MALNGDQASPQYEMRRQARGATPTVPESRWQRRLLWTGIVLFFVIAATVSVCVWLAFIQVRTVSARVRAAVVLLSPEVDAPLLELRVKEKQHVEKGEVLARLDDTELRAALDAAEAARTIRESQCAEAEANLQMARARAAANLESANAGVSIAEARVGSANAALSARQARLTEEIKRAQARCEQARANLALVRRGPREENIQAADARLEAAKAMLGLYTLEVKQSERLVVEGIDSQHLLAVRKTRLTTQGSAVREAELNLRRLKAGPTDEEVRASEQAVAACEADLALARASAADLESLRADITIRDAERTEARAELTQVQARKAEIAVAEERCKAAGAALERAEAEVAGRHAALGAREIVSPVAGTVTRTFDEVGEIVRRGVPTILVAEDGEARWIEGFVREEDAMLVDIGQRAKVRVPAGSGRYVPARVEQIGMHTLSLDGAGSPSSDGRGAIQQERVWVKIRPLEPLKGNPITGTTARAIIRVR